MPETAQKAPQPTPTPSRAAAGARPPRITRAGGDGDGGAPTGEAPVVLSQEAFRRIGETLNGTHWQSDVARDIGCSKSQITRYLDTSGNPRTSRELTPLIASQLQHVIIERICELTELFDIPGMPHAGTPASQEAAETIRKALERIPGIKPRRHGSGE